MLLILFSAVAGHGQLMQINSTPGGYQWQAGKFMDLRIPYGVDTPNVTTSRYGQPTQASIFMKTGDSSLWVRTASRWIPWPGGGGGGGDTSNLSYRIDTLSDAVVVRLYYRGGPVADSFFYEKNGAEAFWYANPAEDRVISWSVTWTGTGLDYSVTAFYRLGGNYYTLSNEIVTLPPLANPALSRKDLFIVDTSPAAGSITGTESATPFTPPLTSPFTQLALTDITLNPGQTTGLTDTLIVYDQLAAGEFENRSATGTTATFNNTTNTYRVPYSVNVGALTNNDVIGFGTETPRDIASKLTLSFAIQLKAVMPNNKGMLVSLWNNGVQIGNDAGIPFNRTDLNYQTFSIPLTLFNLTSTTIDSVSFRFSGGGAAYVGIYMDWIFFQGNMTGGSGAFSGPWVTEGVGVHVDSSLARVYNISADTVLLATHHYVDSSIAAGGSGITSLNTDVVATGPGAAVATIQPNVVTYPKMQQMVGLSVLGRSVNTTGNMDAITPSAKSILITNMATTAWGNPDSSYFTSGFHTLGYLSTIFQAMLNGTGYVKMSGTTPAYRTNAQLTSDVNTFTQTLSGAVPAPTTLNNYFLRDDGTWAAGGGTSAKAYAPLLVRNDSVYHNFNVKAYGATGDGRCTYTGAMTASSATLTAAAGTFAAGDVGKTVVLRGAGTSGRDLVTTISSYTNSATVTLGTTAGTSVTGKKLIFGSDQTTYIQAAITACIAAGGGDVYIPRGIYIIAGALQTSVSGANPNSQIYIPATTAGNDSNRTGIRIVGEGAPQVTPMGFSDGTGLSMKGTVLYSTITGSGTNPSMFGSISATGFQSFSYNNVVMEYLTIAMVGNKNGTGPVMGGVNFGKVASFSTNYVYVNADKDMESVQPSEDVAGIVTTLYNGEFQNVIQNTFSSGFKYGIILGEHQTLVQSGATACHFGIILTNTHHTTHTERASLQWNKVTIYIPNSDFLGIPAPSIGPNFSMTEANIEIWAIGTGKWNDNLYVLSDSGNRSTGSIYYHVVKAGVGKDNSLWNKYNATGAYAYPSITGISGIPKPTLGGMLPAQTEIWSSYSSLNTGSLEINSGQSTSNDTKFASLNLVTNQSGTSNSVGSIYFANSAVAGAEKRLAAIGVATDGATNSGFMSFGTSLSGVVGEAMRITKDNQVAIGTTSASAPLTVGGSSLDPIKMIGSNTARVTMYMQSTNSASQVNLYLENNRGSFASYGGFLYGGSTNATGNLFGVSRADKLFLFADGASNLGMAVGTLSAQPFILGTNNAERIKISSTGITNLFKGANVASAATITPTGNAFHVTGTTTITSVSATGITAGTTITIIFDGVLTFTDGSNLKLAGNMTTAADATITLVYDGTNWFEIARSTN